jgi:hypothetical protein
MTDMSVRPVGSQLPDHALEQLASAEAALLIPAEHRLIRHPAIGR